MESLIHVMVGGVPNAVDTAVQWSWMTDLSTMLRSSPVRAAG